MTPGEFADLALSDVMDAEDLALDYRTGRLSRVDAFEAGIIDEHGADVAQRARAKTCRHCGAAGLRWLKTATGWRLATEAGAVHACANYTPRDIRIVECRACDGEGRILRGYDVDYGECPVCHGGRVEECEAEPVEHCPDCNAIVSGDGISIDEHACWHCRGD